ncbi:winged helix-turn-helix transcriptional regulator [Streptomyces massasporeus]|uniref:winged helix-turn-helix transcriptional regulator n=1 Tax=Streptomyces massasporeus TaxID=67324 RepID=UPI0037B38815
MPDISLTMLVLLCVAALAAGWIDAVVGGGRPAAARAAGEHTRRARARHRQGRRHRRHHRRGRDVRPQGSREMEADGLVHREFHDEVPPRVEYSLTPRGVSLNEALEPLGAWGRTHVPGVSAAAGQVREDDDVPLVPGAA